MAERKDAAKAEQSSIPIKVEAAVQITIKGEKHEISMDEAKLLKLELTKIIPDAYYTCPSPYTPSWAYMSLPKYVNGQPIYIL